MAYERNGKEVLEVTQTYETSDANKLIKNGWILLNTSAVPSTDSSSGYKVIYFLGWYHSEKDAPYLN